MALEVEYKFLVLDERWRRHAGDGRLMRQGYLANSNGVSVRVRVRGERAWINVKHARSLTVREEYEYAIPLADAQEMLGAACADRLVEKTRYEVEHAGHTWEVDVFHGENDGLVVAEVELAAEGEPFEQPEWLGQDVSEDPRYLNQNLAVRPYRHWVQD